MENNTNKYNCILCKYETSYPSEWIKHTKTKKHERLGKPKPNKCEKCDYEGFNHWNMKQHMLIMHSTLEERKQAKYYCNTCDVVFFCSAYMNKHINGKHHKIKVEANIILAKVQETEAKVLGGNKIV